MKRMPSQSKKTILCFAHRGASGYEPENTLLAIQHAITLGANWIEIDVHRSEDQLIVIHDERLERTTNGIGSISEHPLEYLRSLDAGKGERIPLLREVLDLLNRRAGINIELKGTDTARLAAALLEEYVGSHGWSDDDFIVSSFDYAQLSLIRKLRPGTKIGVLTATEPEAALPFASAIRAYSFHPGIRCVTRELVDRAHELGLKVFVFTANHPTDIRRMKALGIDGLFTNYPDRVLERLKEP